MIKDLNYYLNIDYDIIVRELSEEEGGGFFAYYADFKGVMGDGSTKEEAIKDAKLAFKESILVSIKNQDKIYEPLKKDKAVRINMTIKENILRYIDDYCKENKMTRSSFLLQASIDKLNLSN